MADADSSELFLLMQVGHLVAEELKRAEDGLGTR